MLRSVFLFSTLLLVRVLALQVPLSSVNRQRTELHSLNDEKWSLDELPNPNATDHLVFETVHSLLQHWPNTRMRNGHNIVPGRIPKGTLLYHGTESNELPPGPEWATMDPEHSYIFCRAISPDKGCWHLTLTTTRPLKVIYFDGNSAANIPSGPMDTQDLIIWGSSHNHDRRDEPRKIQDLCKWGKNLGLDGFVRMEMDFEIMLCDFTSGVSVVSFLHLESRVDELREVFTYFEAANAGSSHDHFPGEIRIQLDLAGLVSFYDTRLAPSLIPIRAGQERWDHRARYVSDQDLLAVKSRLETVLTRPEGQSSGVGWMTLVRVIVDRYAKRLELMRYLLNSSVKDPDEILSIANRTQAQLRIMLTPYLLVSAIPPNQSDKGDLGWTIPIYKHCSTTYAHFVKPVLESMTDSEKLLLQAVRGTTREICRIVTRMWAAGVYAGVDRTLNTKIHPDIAEVTLLLNTWAEELDHLMAWLDWNVWVKCNPACGPEERCYLPTWPFGFPDYFLAGVTPPLPPSRSGPLSDSFDSRAVATRRLAEQAWHPVKHGPEDDWIRPQPKCVGWFDPYEGVAYDLLFAP